jgi:hypothetical protein
VLIFDSNETPFSLISTFGRHVSGECQWHEEIMQRSKEDRPTTFHKSNLVESTHFDAAFHRIYININLSIKADQPKSSPLNCLRKDDYVTREDSPCRSFYSASPHRISPFPHVRIDPSRPMDRSTYSIDQPTGRLIDRLGLRNARTYGTIRS